MVLVFKIDKPTDFVFEYLTDMQKYVLVHPIISKIDCTGNQRYTVYETLNAGPIPISFTYPVTIESNKKNLTVIIRALVFKLVNIEMTFSLKPENGFTVIEEVIKFKSILPLKSIMQGIFKKQHEQLFKNIESLKTEKVIAWFLPQLPVYFKVSIGK